MFVADGLGLDLRMNVPRLYTHLFSAFAIVPYPDSVCDAPPDASLDEQNCIIKYTPTTPISWVIALQIEDFERSSPTVALSSSSLQFIVQVYLDASTCQTRMWPLSPMGRTKRRNEVRLFILFEVPSYVGVQPTRSCILLVVGEIVNEVAQFVTGCANQAVTEVETQKPVGMEIENVLSYAMFTVTCFENWHTGMMISPVKRQARNSSLFTMSITWTPSLSDLGVHFVCFVPVSRFKTKELFSYEYVYGSWMTKNDKVVKLVSDTWSVMIKKYKDQTATSRVSILLLKAGCSSTNTCSCLESQIPTGQVNATTSRWSIRYTSNVIRPSITDIFIRFYAKSTGREVHVINVRTDETNVQYLEGTLLFLTRITWTEVSSWMMMLREIVMRILL